MKQTCTNCGHVGWQTEFVARSAVHPWCLACRKAKPKEAKKAYDHMRFHKEYQKMTPAQRRAFRNKTHKDKKPLPEQIKMSRKPIIKLEHTYVYCPCGKELSYGQLQKSANAKYCSNSCANTNNAKKRTSEDFKAMGQKGNIARWGKK